MGEIWPKECEHRRGQEGSTGSVAECGGAAYDQQASVAHVHIGKVDEHRKVAAVQPPVQPFKKAAVVRAELHVGEQPFPTAV